MSSSEMVKCPECGAICESAYLHKHLERVHVQLQHLPIAIASGLINEVQEMSMQSVNEGPRKGQGIVTVAENTAYPIDPLTVTNSFVFLPSNAPMPGHDAKRYIDTMQASLHSTQFWASVMDAHPQLPTFALQSTDDSDPLVLMIALDKAKVAIHDSLFLLIANLSLDGGQTTRQVLVGFSFTEAQPRVIIGSNHGACSTPGAKRPQAPEEARQRITARKTWCTVELGPGEGTVGLDPSRVVCSVIFTVRDDVDKCALHAVNDDVMINPYQERLHPGFWAEVLASQRSIQCIRLVGNDPERILEHSLVKEIGNSVLLRPDSTYRRERHKEQFAIALDKAQNKHQQAIDSAYYKMQPALGKALEKSREEFIDRALLDMEKYLGKEYVGFVFSDPRSQFLVCHSGCIAIVGDARLIRSGVAPIVTTSRATEEALQSIAASKRWWEFWRPSSTPAIADVQLAGMKCVLCGQRIAFHTDGLFCPRCGKRLHTHCAQTECPHQEITADTQSNTAADVKVYDYRSAKEKTFEAEARQGRSLGRTADALVEELIEIARTQSLNGGEGPAYDAHGRHVLARQIGMTLHERGGFELMQQVAYRFVLQGGSETSLGFCWNGVGKWMA